MRFFLSDGVHGGGHTAKALSEQIMPHLPHIFYAGTYEPLREGLSEASCLILHVIADHKGFGYAPDDIEPLLKNYIYEGNPVLLLHASSAAFTQWKWWRRLVGLRWVRRNDPDNRQQSRHLRFPYELIPATTKPSDLALKHLVIQGDEYYVDLYQEGTVDLFMHGQLKNGNQSPQVFLSHNKRQHLILSYLPGHAVSTVIHPDYTSNIINCVHWLERQAKTSVKLHK